MYKAILTKSYNLQPEIIEINFITKIDSKDREWIHPVPGVTGYEGAQVKKIVEEYIKDKPVFCTWTACSGTLNKYDRLEIPMSEIIRYLEDVGRITVEKEYGYIRKVNWNDTLSQTNTGEEK